MVNVSLALRCQTCAACGKTLDPTELTDIEPLIDDQIRYIAVCVGCSTFPHREATARAH
jgi:hypothetical protein